MKKILLGITGLLFIGLQANAQASNYEIGEVVDNFTVTDTEGNEHDLYDITATGKHVYLDFFFDTCPPCQATSPIFGEFYDKYGCNSGELYCLVINNGSDSDAEVIAYEDEFGGPGHHAPAVSADGGGGDVTSNFGVSAFPTYVLIGPDNRLVEKDIYPIADITTFEGTFYGDFNPDPMPCSFASIEKEPAIGSLTTYPNPATDLTTISFSAKSEGEATISVYNLLGEQVLTNITGTVSGQNNIQLDVAGFESGQYIIQVLLGDAIVTARLEIMP